MFEQTSTVYEFAEQTAVISRVMYAAPNLRTRHRLVALDVPTPRWMRAPGEAPGSFALESAMDELAEACGVDPIDLRVRNEPAVEPEGGRPFSSRNLVACLREGATRFGWAGRDPRPGVRRDGRWLIGTGVAASTYPARSMPSTASVALEAGRFVVRVTAADIGTGARTALTQVAADELAVPLEQVDVRIGDSDYGPAMIAGGSMGTASWSWAVIKACRQLRATIDELGDVPASGLVAHADTTDDIAAPGRPGASRLRGPVRRGPSGRRHRRDTGPPTPGCVRGGPDHQRQDRPLPTGRRDDHGTVDGPFRGVADGRPVRRLPQP